MFNDLAWLLATCPDVRLRNPQDAVIFAKHATEILPNDRAIWNTLGVSYYRIGNWKEARIHSTDRWRSAMRGTASTGSSSP